MIRSIGLFWDEADIFWAKGSQSGKLLGVPADKVTATPIDFRDQVGIYVLHANFEIVYVGQTGIAQGKLLLRLKHHRTDDLASRWNRFSWFGVRWVKANNELSALATAAHPALKDVLNHMEAIVIHTTEPPLNKQGGRFGQKVITYSQVRDKRLGPTEADMIKDLWLSKKSKRK